MIAFMHCVAEAVMAKGVRGLADMVPGGPYLLEIAADAMKRLRDRRNREQIRDDVRKAAEATMEAARVAAEKIAREVASSAGTADRITLELYLTQIPGAVRRSLRRPDDPTGTTVPVDLRLDTAVDMLRRLPHQMPRFRTGQQLPGQPNWTLLEPLGAGGFGEVWKVGHEFAEPRAVKFCTDATTKEQLLTHEAKLVARVMKQGRHENVVPLMDADLKCETPWLAYEYVSGGDLTGLILGWQRLPVEERMKQTEAALKTLAETVGHFHALVEAGKLVPLVHRDLKPANILVKKTGGKARLMITDFGIGGIAASSQLHEAREGTNAATRGVSMLAGAYTPLYASTAQQRGDPPHPRDDVHALGVIGYQMLTGKLDSAPGARFDRELRELGISDSLINLIGDCVDPDVKQQPATGIAVSERLKTKAAPPPVPLPVPPSPEPKPSGSKIKRKPQPEPEPDVVTDEEEPEPEPPPPVKENVFASGFAWFLLLFQAVLASFVALMGLFFGATLRDGPEGATVVLFLVLGVTAVTNFRYARGQPARRRLKCGVISWLILIGFGVVQAQADSRRYSSYTPPPTTYGTTIKPKDDYGYGYNSNSTYYGSTTTKGYDSPPPSRGLGSSDVFRGFVVCLMELALTGWFVRGRPRKPADPLPL